METKDREVLGVGGPNSELDTSLAEVFDDPVLRELAQRVLLGVSEISDKLGSLAVTDPTSEETERVLDQAKVDRLITHIVGEDKADETFAASDSFKDVNRTARNKFRVDDNTTVLNASVGGLIFGEHISRGLTRRLAGPDFAKCRSLIEFWENSKLSLTKDEISLIKMSVVGVVDDRIETATAAYPAGEQPELESFNVAINRVREVDPDTDISALKFLVFGAVVNVFKQEIVLDAHKTLKDESTSRVNESPHATYYWATEFLEKIEQDELRDVNMSISWLMDNHQKSRFMGIPSRKFKSILAELSELSNLYRLLSFTENNLGKLSSVIDSMENNQGTLKKQATDKLVWGAIDLCMDGSKAMVEHQNQKIHSDAADPSTSSKAWEEGQDFDKVLNASANSLVKLLDEHGLEIYPSTQAELDICKRPGIKEQYDKRSLEAQLQQLRPEIDVRLSAFQLIEDEYVITSKQLRERQPQLISLAKMLTDSLPESETISKETARGLVGLMLGVYWGEKGEPSTDSENANKYLDEADALRQLTAELEFLGQPAPESNLLTLINLLDELIDTGFFDNLRRNPELKVFEDFLVAYFIAKDEIANKGVADVEPEEEADSPELGDEEAGDSPVLEVKDVDETPEPEQPELPNEQPVLPVEALGQAEYEDIKVFPPGAGSGDVISDFIKGIEEKDMPTIEWERITKIVELRDQFTKQNVEAKLVRTKHAGWQVLPFFVLELKLPGNKYGVAVVESPVYGNATYIYRESIDRLPWQDAVQLRRHEARNEGATSAVHVDSKRMDIHFKKIWNRVISELTINQ